jgi:hypothetical protein
MGVPKFLLLRNNFKYIAWFLWSIFVYNALVYFYHPFAASKEIIQKSDNVNILFVSLAIVAVIEAAATILFRYFTLIRPAKKGTYTPYSGPIRFLLVGVVNWACSNSIIIYGLVLYYMSGETWFLLFYGIVGSVLLFFHSPRMGPFKNKLIPETDNVDTSFSQAT